MPLNFDESFQFSMHIWSYVYIYFECVCSCFLQLGGSWVMCHALQKFASSDWPKTSLPGVTIGDVRIWWIIACSKNDQVKWPIRLRKINWKIDSYDQFHQKITINWSDHFQSMINFDAWDWKSGCTKLNPSFIMFYIVLSGFWSRI